MFTVFKKIKKSIFFTIIMILVFFSVYNLVRMNIKSSSQEIRVQNSNLPLKLDNMKEDIVNKKLLNLKIFYLLDFHIIIKLFFCIQCMIVINVFKKAFIYVKK